MVKLAWGNKRTCLSCSSRFYDLGRSPIVCPKCGSVLELQSVGRGKRGRAAANAKSIGIVDDIHLIDDIAIDDTFEGGLEVDDGLIEDADVLDDELEKVDVHSDLDRI